MEYIKRYAEKDIERALRSSGAVEIKLGGDKLIEEGAKSLILLKNKLATKSQESAPSFMMILTARGSLYQREDGIYVVPVNCLKD